MKMSPDKQNAVHIDMCTCFCSSGDTHDRAINSRGSWIGRWCCESLLLGAVKTLTPPALLAGTLVNTTAVTNTSQTSWQQKKWWTQKSRITHISSVWLTPYK